MLFLDMVCLTVGLAYRDVGVMGRLGDSVKVDSMIRGTMLKNIITD
jgi:hypothetical protein